MDLIRHALVAIGCLLFPGAGGNLLQASEEGLSALDSFRNQRVGEVLGMVGFFGQPHPPQWLVLYSARPESKVLHEVVVSGGKIRAERKFRRLPGQDLPSIPIRRDALKIDSGEAFRIAEGVAEQAKVSFENAHYQLRCREAGSEPVWMIQLISRAQVSLGVVYLSARTGEVLRVAWVEPSTRKDDSTGLESFASGSVAKVSPR